MKNKPEMGNLKEKQAQRAFGKKIKRKNKTSRLVKCNRESYPKKTKMSTFTQKHAQISFCSKLKEKNGHEI